MTLNTFDYNLITQFEYTKFSYLTLSMWQMKKKLRWKK